MKLPNAHLCVVDREKITEYLLNPAHPDNGGKAAFLQALGFTRDDWQTLAAAFTKLATAAEVSRVLVSAHGRKYIVDARIETPSGKMPFVRTVWVVDRGLEAPRLVTAYPHTE